MEQAVFRYGILQWKETELKTMYRKSRKTMTMYGALHPESGGVERFYVKRKKKERDLTSVERWMSDEFGFLCCQF